ncbi:hypothetical protein H4Q26_003173 [Puccinia striiformis f. sp. tritici PST-130]|nr:hypothetical protein H4Q26_003173 [Puccinia striiformis f. sp. tritici PST-130]
MVVLQSAISGVGVESRQPPPHRSTLSARLSSKPTKNRQSRIIGNQSQSETAIDTLRKLLQSRWDPVTKLLDLANLAQDKILKAAGIALQVRKARPQNSWSYLETMHRDLPKRTIDITSRQSTAELTTNVHKVTNLPIRSSSSIPKFEVLDGEAIDPIMKATITTASLNGSTSMSKPSGDTLLLPIQPPYHYRSNPPFDENRQSLMDVYATKSSFSLFPTWNEYINISRNNARLKGAKLSERIANGPAEIIEYMKRIPGTKHPIQSAEDQHKFVVDSWQMPGLVNESTSSSGAVIYVTIHGEFQEFPSLTVRSFDRTFMLGAAGPASAAALKGWPCVILTDQLTVRGYSSPQAWSTTAPLPQTTIPNSVPILASSLPTPTSTVSAQPELTSEQKNQLVQKLMDLTKLNMNFTIDCLTQNHWDLDNSIKNFNDILSRGGLPSDAFLHQLP